MGWRKLLLLLWGLLTISLVIDKYKGPAFSFTTPFSEDASASVEGLYSENEVPELKEILGSDQATRLTAGRRLVERVGVDQALEILEHSALPHTGEGHLVVHQVGFYAYRTYGIDSILKCKDYFLYACYHGAIIEAASDQGFEAIVKMTDKCKDSPVRYFQCVHAAGHSILAMWNYDLPEALSTCDRLYKDEIRFPEALSSCHNGAFMENLFGVHDWGTGEAPKRDWLSDDPYYPCNYFGEEYQKGCWLNQAARIYDLNKGDLVKTAKLCEEIGVGRYTEWCIDNASRQIHALTNGSIDKVFELCNLLGTNWNETCITVNAGSYYSVGDAESAINICKRVYPLSKDRCYQQVTGQIPSSPWDNDKRGTCSKMEMPFSAYCLSQLPT